MRTMIAKRNIRSHTQPWEEAEDSDNWMLSYSDMMTLLFAFFALLLALSDLNVVKMEIVSNSMNRALGGAKIEPEVTLAQVHAELENIIRKENLTTQVKVNRDRLGISLSLRGSTFFQSGSTALLEPALPFLAMVARQIKQVPYQIAVEGHTDNVPISTEEFPSNWELSSSRAAKVVRFFIDKGIPTHRLRATGYADTRPVDPGINNNTSQARAQNRRIVIMFLSEIKKPAESE